ncbi:MAG: hypothetical protein ACYSWU_29475, partial [Planctomycetota bacterium]
MDIRFPTEGFHNRAEIQAALMRLQKPEGAGRWTDGMDDLEVLRRLPGGRGGGEVIEIVVERDHARQPKVVKLGPIHDLGGEYEAYRKHLINAAGRFFASIEAATPGVLDPKKARPGQREAVVYSHAKHLTGGSNLRTFEQLAQAALRDPKELEAALRGLRTLFSGIQSDLYGRWNDVGEARLFAAWNRRLGIDAVVRVERFDRKQRLLTVDGGDPRQVYPLDVVEASVRHDGDLEPD